MERFVGEEPDAENDCLGDDGCLKTTETPGQSVVSEVEEIAKLTQAWDKIHQERNAAATPDAVPALDKSKQPDREIWAQEDIEELGALVDNLQIGDIVKLHAFAQESCDPEKPAKDKSLLPGADPMVSLPQSSSNLELPDTSNDLLDVESNMQLHDGSFALVRHLASHLDMGMGLKMRKQTTSQWRQRFYLGAKLGDGAQASVYQARAASEPGPALSLLNGLGCGGFAAPVECSQGEVASACSSTAPQVCSDFISPDGRQVAIKLFHKPRSPAFQKELTALLKIGAHPHVVRLLESYQNDLDEDVIVLELCDCDLYELYRHWFYQMSALLERLIARLVGQLLQALDYLKTRGVAHRDIKLENIMIHQMEDLEAVELKLGDFGWAGLADANGRFEQAPKVCGTLWYSPPECSPPLKKREKSATSEQSGASKTSRPALDPERSDMWSVGVVTYLLHVGQNPFKSFGSGVVQDENEALQRAASGTFDAANSRWRRLPEDVRDFIQSALKVTPSERPTPSEALRHAYLRRVRQDFRIDATFISSKNHKQKIWQLMDAFQRLAWLAVARAVSEVEIDREIAAGALHITTTLSAETAASSTTGLRYLTELAKELAVMPFIGKAWEQMILLAFRYIDVDSDGLLGTKDLARHLCIDARSLGSASSGARSSIFSTTSDQALAAANVWITRWRSSRRERTLGIPELRNALFAHRGSFTAERTSSGSLRPGAAPAASQQRKVMEKPIVEDEADLQIESLTKVPNGGKVDAVEKTSFEGEVTSQYYKMRNKMRDMAF